MSHGVLKSARLLILVCVPALVLSACGPSGPVVVVHVSGARGAATALRLSLNLNDQPATQPELFAPSTTELNLEVPTGSLGKLALQLDAINCHECTSARATATQFLVGADHYDLGMTLAELPTPLCPAGPLLSPRWYMDPILLDRGPSAGQVFIAAGSDLTGSKGAQLVNEIYDPKTITSRRSYELLGVTSSPRRLHDGRVIMEGGYDSLLDQYVALVQMYDPVADRLTKLAPLRSVRSGHAVLVLADGRLIVMGGKTEPPRRHTTTAEIYDPTTDTWTPVDNMAEGRLYSSAVLLKDGRVLVSGGSTQAGGYPRSIEVFDPKAPSGSQWRVAGNLMVGRFSHASFVLPDGKVLIVGGAIDGAALESAELFDPSLPGSTAVPVATAPFPFSGASFVSLPNGSVLATGGGTGRATTNTQIFNPATSRFEAGPPLALARADHASVVLPDDSILLLGGVGGPIVRDVSAVPLLPTERLYFDSCPPPSSSQ